MTQTDDARGPETCPLCESVHIVEQSHAEAYMVCKGCGCEGHGSLWALTRADLAPIPQDAVKVKPLEWERGMVDWARPLPGMKYVACSTTPAGSWAWWLEGAPETRAAEPSEEAAKAAAQADYAARIMSALEPTPQDARVLDVILAFENVDSQVSDDGQFTERSWEQLRAALAAFSTGCNADG